MNTNDMAQIAAAAISGYKKNKIIMNFVTTEAHEKVASEMRERQPGTVTTGKAVEVLSMRYPNIAARVNEYINSGLLGCYMASLEA
jgi:hypothetical protein